MGLLGTGTRSTVLCICSAGGSWFFETFYSTWIECYSTKYKAGLSLVPRNATLLVLKDLSFVYGVFFEVLLLCCCWEKQAGFVSFVYQQVSTELLLFAGTELGVGE